MYHHQWLYHETLAPAGKMVRSELEEAALGEGWVDTPAKFGKPHAPTEVEAADLGRPPEMVATITEPPPAPVPVKPTLRGSRR